jgi:hypothetical protein
LCEQKFRKKNTFFFQRINEIYETLRQEYENHVPIYLKRVEYLESQIAACGETDVEKKIGLWEEVFATMRTASTKINKDAVLKYLGEKNHDLSDELKK